MTTSAVNSRAFFKAFKETLIAYSFDVGGLFAGFMIASQIGIFELSPWAIAMYPAIVSAKGVIGGLISGRLGTALHLGIIYPRFFKNTKNFYKLIEAMIVQTLLTSVMMSAVSLVFGYLLWGVTLADFSSIFAVVVATMALGLTLSIITIKVAFISFEKGLDPDIIVYPIMSTVADIFITICYILVLNLFFLSGYLGKSATVIICLVHLILMLYFLLRNIREEEFVKTIKESLFTMVFVVFIVNVTGTILKQISTIIEGRREIYTVYPAIIDLVGDVGSVVGSTATTKLALGFLKPSLSSIRNHSAHIVSAWASSMIMFVLLAFLSLGINGIFTLSAFYNLISILLIVNFIAVAAIIVVSYAVSILTFQKGLDPDNFVIPIESSLADSITSIALLVALMLVK